MHMHSLLYVMFLFQGKGLQTTYWLDKRLDKPINTTKECVTDVNLDITGNEQLDQEAHDAYGI